MYKIADAVNKQHKNPGVNMKKQIIFIILITCLVISCSKSEIPTNPSEIDEGLVVPLVSVPGQVSVGFADSVNYVFINSFLKELDLTPIHISADSSFTFWVQVDSGETNKQLSLLLQNPKIAWADQRGYPFEDRDIQKEYILIHFSGEISVKDAHNIINSTKGLKWKKTLVPPRSARIKVTIGSEKQWIDSLKKYSFVSWADITHVTRISDN